MRKISEQENMEQDQNARERILHDLTTTFIVEAGAGSGKTTSLVGRMINLIRYGHANIHQIAAITFTKKAASELQGRFRIKLEQEIRKTQSDVERILLQEAVRNMNQSFIGTIHSFCGGLLRERPIEAQLDPTFTEMDEIEGKEFRDACWDQYIEDHPLDELAKYHINIEDLRAVFHRVSQYEDVRIVMQEVKRPDFNLIQLSLPSMLNQASSYIPTTAPEKGWDGLQTLIKQAQLLLKHKGLEADMDVLALAKLFDKTLGVTLNRWTDKDMAKEIKEQFMDWQNTVMAPFLQHWREFLHPKLIQYVKPAIAYCHERRMQAGMLDFQDLLMKATELLREHRSVRAYFNKRYTHLLVDEFQDTDPIQAEMMLLLTGTNLDEKDWKVQLPRAGSLFIVGDPKQSIYRFRRADISTYNFVKQRIALSGGILQLTRNFRSIHAIGDYVNYAFEAKFTPVEEQSDQQAAYVRMLTQRPNPKDKQAMHGVYTLSHDKVHYDRKTDIAEMDSERIARYIAWACKGNLKIQDRDDTGNEFFLRSAVPSDFMILLKRREFISLYAEKLERYGISADTSGSRADFIEIRTLAMLASCLNDQTDRIPLLAVLRGMLFGVSDDALFHYRREVGYISLFPLPEPEALSVQALPVLHALRKLSLYANWVRTQSAFTAFSQITADIGFIPYAASKETGAIRSGTLVKILQTIQQDEVSCADWDALTHTLQNLLEGDGVEGTSLFAGGDHSVRIMNLHKAKGLEAAVIFLACPCGHSDHDAEAYIDRLAEPASGYFTISVPKDQYNDEVIGQPIGWTALSEKERGYMHAEADRLLYVAVTRAKQLLVVSRYPSKIAIDPWSKLANSLDMQLELDDVEIKPAVAEKVNLAPDSSVSLKPWKDWVASASEPTYLRTNVTGQVKDGSEIKLVRPSGGRGMAFGSVVHRLIEVVGQGSTLDQIASYVNIIAEEEKLDVKWVPDTVAAITALVESSIWQRGLKAKQKHHEFSFMVGKRDEANKSTLVKGIIDYLFEEDDGWVLVDFKTDSYDDEHEQSFIDFYKPQVMAYVREWEQTFGMKVKEAGLYFVGKERYIKL
jgi:ATP-dependent helicase/nuclease subunit A